MPLIPQPPHHRPAYLLLILQQSRKLTQLLPSRRTAAISLRLVSSVFHKPSTFVPRDIYNEAASFLLTADYKVRDSAQVNRPSVLRNRLLT